MTCVVAMLGACPAANAKEFNVFNASILTSPWAPFAPPTSSTRQVSARCRFREYCHFRFCCRANPDLSLPLEGRRARLELRLGFGSAGAVRAAVA